MSPPGFYWQFVIVWLWDAGTWDRPWCNGYHNYFTLHSTMGRSDTGRGGGTQHCLQTIHPVTACDGGTAAPKLNLGCSEKIGFSIQLLYNWRNEYHGKIFLIDAHLYPPWMLTSETLWASLSLGPLWVCTRGSSLSSQCSPQCWASQWELATHGNIYHQHQPQLSLPCSWVISF